MKLLDTSLLHVVEQYLQNEILLLLEENDEPLWYNKSNFDADTNRYARHLPSENYTIDNYQILIPAGERTGKMMLKVKGDGLSPDSIYFYL